MPYSARSWPLSSFTSFLMRFIIAFSFPGSPRVSCSLSKPLVRSRLCRVALAANARAAFVPSSSVSNRMRSQLGKLYGRRAAQQRRGAGAALAVASVNTWVEREPPSFAAATSASGRFGRLLFLNPHRVSTAQLGADGDHGFAVELSSDGAATAPI